MTDPATDILRIARDFLAAGDMQAAQKAIEAHGTPIEIAARYKEVLLDQYWKAKNLAGAVAIGQCGISFCMNHKLDLRSEAKQMAFNIGSFTWPGWAEPGIEIRETEWAAGADAASLNLRLAIELNKPPLGMSSAHWLIGAHALAARDAKAAADAFNQAFVLAPPEMRPMHTGYVAIARLMEDGEDESSLRDLVALFSSLDAEGTEDSKFAASQLRTAARVFLNESIIAAINNHPGPR
jgi:hypothetical protein